MSKDEKCWAYKLIFKKFYESKEDEKDTEADAAQSVSTTNGESSKRQSKSGENSLNMHDRILRSLRSLDQANQRRQSAFISSCSKELIAMLGDCCRHITKGEIKIEPHHFNKLRRHNKQLRKLALKKTSLIERRKILQSGGFLNVLIPPRLSLLTSVPGDLFQNN